MITKLGKSLHKILPFLLGSLAAGAINGYNTNHSKE